MAEKHRFRKTEIRVKLSLEEHEILKQKAFEYGITMSEFVRMIAIIKFNGLGYESHLLFTFQKVQHLT